MPKAKSAPKPRKPAYDPRPLLGPNVDLGPTKPAIGRPSTYHPSYCAKVIEFGKLGYSPTEIACQLNVDRDTMMGWAENEGLGGRPFSVAIARAKDEEQAWWEARGRKGLEDRHFNAHLWVKVMACRFRRDYADKVEVTGADGGPILFQTVYEEPPKTIDVTPTATQNSSDPAG